VPFLMLNAIGANSVYFFGHLIFIFFRLPPNIIIANIWLASFLPLLRTSADESTASAPIRRCPIAPGPLTRSPIDPLPAHSGPCEYKCWADIKRTAFVITTVYSSRYRDEMASASRDPDEPGSVSRPCVGLGRQCPVILR
jgi:hypothetical protein